MHRLRSPSKTARCEESFSNLYGRYLAPMRAKCRRLLGSADADDVAHEAFTRLLETQAWSRQPLSANGSFTRADDIRSTLAWLYRTSTRLAIDIIRSRKTATRGEAAEGELDVVPCGGAPQDALEAREIIRHLGRDIPTEELEAAVLCRVDGLTQPEAAEVLEISERTVRRLLDRFEDRIARYKEELVP